MAQRQAAADERRKAEAVCGWRSSGFMPLHADRIWNGEYDAGDDADRAQMREMVGYVERGGVVALLGPNGTGKTQLAAAVSFLAAKRLGIQTRYYRAMDYFGGMRKRMDAPDATDVEKRACQAGLLVFDEFHERMESDWERRVFTQLIDTRYGNRRPTVIITNLVRSEFVAGLGPSVVSRIAECGKSYIIDRKDWRKKNAQGAAS